MGWYGDTHSKKPLMERKIYFSEEKYMKRSGAAPQKQ
jgi:hypothetical protein